jgi:hypothetical protein
MNLYALVPLLLTLALSPEPVAERGEDSPFTLEEETLSGADAPLRGRVILDAPLGPLVEIHIDGQRVLHTRGSRDPEDWWLADPEATLHLVEGEPGVLLWSYRPGPETPFPEGEHVATVSVDAGGGAFDSGDLVFHVLQVSEPPRLVDLARAIPNPMSSVHGSGTRIRFVLRADADIIIQGWDREGVSVGDLFRGFRPAGAQEIPWDGHSSAGTALANGAYLVRITASSPGWTGGGTMVMVKVAIWNER